MSGDRIHNAVFVVQREGSAHLRDRLTLRLLRNKHRAATADQLIVITATVRQSIFPAYGGNSPGLRHGMRHVPVASAVPSAEVANLQGACAAPESTAVAILRKALPASFHRAPSDGLHSLLFLRSIPDDGYEPTRFLNCRARRINPRPRASRCSGVIRRYAAMSSGSMFSA